MHSLEQSKETFTQTVSRAKPFRLDQEVWPEVNSRRKPHLNDRLIREAARRVQQDPMIIRIIHAGLAQANFLVGVAVAAVVEGFSILAVTLDQEDHADSRPVVVDLVEQLRKKDSGET